MEYRIWTKLSDGRMIYGSWLKQSLNTTLDWVNFSKSTYGILDSGYESRSKV